MPLRTRSACSFTTRIDCAPAPRPAPHSTLAGAEARPRRPCPISGVPTHKHRPARCACALGRPPVACSDPPLACAGRTRRVWTQPRWPLIASLAQWSRAPVYEAGGWTFESSMRHHLQRPVGLPVRSSALQAEEAGSTPARGTTQKPSSSSRFDGANRPQRLGGVGTRHRQPFHHPGVAQPGRATALGAEGCTFNSCRSDQPLSMPP